MLCSLAAGFGWQRQEAAVPAARMEQMSPRPPGTTHHPQPPPNQQTTPPWGGGCGRSEPPRGCQEDVTPPPSAGHQGKERGGVGDTTATIYLSVLPGRVSPSAQLSVPPPLLFAPPPGSRSGYRLCLQLLLIAPPAPPARCLPRSGTSWSLRQLCPHHPQKDGRHPPPPNAVTHLWVHTRHHRHPALAAGQSCVNLHIKYVPSAY